MLIVTVFLEWNFPKKGVNKNATFRDKLFFVVEKLQKTTTTICFSLFSTHCLHISHYFPMGEIQFSIGEMTIFRNGKILNFPIWNMKSFPKFPWILKISLDRRSRIFPGLLYYFAQNCAQCTNSLSGLHFLRFTTCLGSRYFGLLLSSNDSM